MGAPKKKWNPDEEAALKAGIERYGPGKWSAILNDPEFREILQARTNVDLKDKWRNINVMLNGVGYRQRGIGASRNAKNPKPKVKALAAASETQIPKPQNKALAAGSVIPDSEIQIQIQIPKPQNRAVVASGSGFTDVEILDVKPLATISKDVEPLETGPPVVNRAFRPPIQEVEKRGVKTAVNHEISFDLQKLMNMTADEAAVAAARAVAEAEAAMEAAERAVKEAEAAEEAAEAARQFAQAAYRAYKCVRLN